MEYAKYKGNFYRGTDIGTKQYKQRLPKPNQGGMSGAKSNFRFYVILIGFIALIGLIYFNKKESVKETRNNINDTVELIEKVVNNNLEMDLANQQSIHSARHANLNSQHQTYEDIKRQKRNAYLAEKKKKF